MNFLKKIIRSLNTRIYYSISIHLPVSYSKWGVEWLRLCVPITPLNF